MQFCRYSECILSQEQSVRWLLAVQQIPVFIWFTKIEPSEWNRGKTKLGVTMSSIANSRPALWAVLFLVFGGSNLFAQQPDPDLVAAIQKAQGLIGQNDFSGAEEVLRDATRKFPNKPGPWFLLGYALHGQKKYDDALAVYDKAVKFPAVKATSLYNIACIYSLQEKPDEAFAMLDAAINAGFNNFNQLRTDADFTNIKQDPRFEKYQPKWLSDDKLFVESTRVIHKWSGENAGDQFGWTARRVGDLDGDGVIDFVSTAPTFQNGAGKIYVYSSKTGKLLHEVTGQAGYRLGNSAVGVGDIDQDGTPDFLAGAPNANGKGAVMVYSGKDASVIHEIAGKTPQGQFGYEVSELGDFDGDDVPDFLVGEMTGRGDAPRSGRVIVYSGKSAEPLFDIGGQSQGDGFGNAAAATSIGDGEFLLAIGAQNAGPSNRGRVYVYHVKDAKPKLRFKIEGDQNSRNLGQMFIAFPGDLDRDGTPDVYASDFGDRTRVPGGGKVVVHSGASGEELLALHGGFAGEGLGTSPSDAGDVDGDGIGDLVIGAWQNAEGAKSGGKVYLYSAAGEGKLLRSWTCKQAGDTLGFDACGIGDVDGDGHVDFLLTSAWSNKHGAKTGRVFIVAGEDFSKQVPDEEAADSIKKLVAGKVTTVLDDIDAGTGGINVDASGDIYTADFGSKLNGQGTRGTKLYKVTPDGKSELFCNDLFGGSGNTFDSEGNLFQSSIRGGFVSKVSTDGEATVIARGFKSPVGLVFNSEQELFVCNCGNNSISRVDADGNVTVFCDSPLLNCPNGITVGPDDTLYVCNFSDGNVIKIDTNGTATRLATLPGGNNGHLVYHRGYLYVLARKDCRVHLVDLAGRVEPFVGSGKRGKDDGGPLASSLSLPNSLIISHDEKWMYINETSPTTGNHVNLSPTRIRRVELR